MLARILVAINGVMFLLYGGMCLLDPNTPADMASVVITAASGSVETTAMYGGLQISIGIFLILSALNIQRTITGLEILAYTMGGLGIARLSAIAIYGSDSYNLTVGSYEVICCLLAIYLRAFSLKNKTIQSSN